MKNTLLLSTIVAFAVQTAFANDQTAANRQSQGSPKSVRLSKLMDASIQSNDGKSLGELEDIVVDPTTGEIKFAVIGKGGFLGMGEKLVPVPWQAINVQSERQFTINLDSEKLKSAPTTQDRNYSNLTDPGYTVTVYEFYSIPMGGAGSPGGTAAGQGSSTNSPYSSSYTTNAPYSGGDSSR